MQIFHLFYIKNYFFYFTLLFLQNTHISLSLLHIYSIKYSFFYNFYYYFLHCFSLSLSNPTTIIITTLISLLDPTQPPSSSLPRSLSQTQPPSSSLPRSANRPNHYQHHHSITPHPATIITHPTSIIKENQPIQAETHSIRNPLNPKPIQSKSQIIIHPTWNPLIKQREISGKQRLERLRGGGNQRFDQASCWSDELIGGSGLMSWSNEKNWEWEQPKTRERKN